MESFKHRWERVPSTIRRPVVMIIGTLFILAAALTGWLPGPGGLPLFLIGIAILATEFTWAKKVQDYVVTKVEELAHAWRRHKIIGTVIIVVFLAVAAGAGWLAYTKFKA